MERAASTVRIRSTPNWSWCTPRSLRSAAAIATLVERGKGAEAEALVQSRDSEFGKQSLNVVGILMRFRARYGENVRVTV